MGDEVSEAEPSPRSEGKPLTSAWFDESQPYYLFIGMPYDLYWYGDPWAVWAYHEAHEMRRDEVNQQLWMNGIYVFNAIGTAVANIHLDGKHHKPVPYMDKPLPIRPMTAEEKEARAAKDTEDVIAYLNAWAEAFNKEHGNG